MPPSPPASYNFCMFSDTHLGEKSSYDMNPETNPTHRTTKDISRPEAVMPVFLAMLEQLRDTSDANTQFVIDGGDLIEGGTVGAAVHARQLQLALDAVQTRAPFPLYPVNGNHDDWGNGGREAFKTVVLPHIERLTGQRLTDFANYTVTCGDDFFIFADAYAPASPWREFIHGALDALPTRPRHLFVAVHPHLMPNYEQETIDLCRRLSEYDAVILGGHSHATQILEYERDGHRLTQFLVGTYLPKTLDGCRYTAPSTDLEEFWSRYLPHYAPAPWQDRNVRDQWMPYIHSCWIPRGMGYARFYIDGDAITLSVQSADITQPPLSYKMRQGRHRV